MLSVDLGAQSSTTPARPRDHWSYASNRRNFLLELGKKLGISANNYDSWYNVTNDVIAKNGGRGLLQHYNNSTSQILKDHFKDHSWDITKFSKVPRNYWKSFGNQRTFLEGLGKKLGIKEGDFDAWYKLKLEDIRKHDGIGLLQRHNKSIAKLLKTAFPDHPWDMGRFPNKSRAYWNFGDRKRQFANELGLKLGILEGDFESWYKVTVNDIRTHGGHGFLSRQGNSVLRMLQDSFPEHPWDDSKFAVKRKKYWAVRENQKAGMEEIRAKLGIEPGNYEEWYKVSYDDIVRFGGLSLIRYFESSPSKLIMALYPEFQWDPVKFRKSTRSLPEE